MVTEAALPNVPGFDVGQLIHSGPRSLVYRATAADDGRAVVLRIPQNRYPSDRELAVQHRAFEIARSLSAEAVVEHIALLKTDRQAVLVTADFGGQSLDKLLHTDGPPDLDTALEIAIELARALAAIHDKGIVHRDIRPANIIWNPATKTLRLTDLSMSSRLQSDAADAAEQLLSLGSLAYISPEQTGRINRGVDFRTDLYSAGITLFELLSGRLPFANDDPRRLVHAHLATAAPALDAIVPELPAPIAAVVGKLLAKDPEQRYASAAGLEQDLLRCLHGLRAGGIEAFEPGADEVRSRLVFPARLYGRDRERQTLLDAIEAARGGRREALLVAGYSGIGKSALINEAQAPVARADGWFCAGKFDQFRRDVPYLAWRGALTSLVHQLLASPDDELSAIRAGLSDPTLRDSLGLIVELVPELASVLGFHPATPDVDAADRQLRFTQTLRRFLRVVASGDHLLVLFLDDLQWADLASLTLLEAIVADREPANLLVLGAYRDNEVGHAHPLTAAIHSLRDQGHQIETLTLPPLSPDDVLELTSDTLVPAADPCNALAELVHAKTGGNPFFLRQFISDLHRKALLRFDTNEGCWQWRMADIEDEGFTDNVVDFMSRRLAELPDDSLQAIQFAACLGADFDLRTLASIAGWPLSATAEQLEPALLAGFLRPADRQYRYAAEEARLAELDGRPVEVNPRYEFIHDRVQQTAHAALPEADRARLHLIIARDRLADFAADGDSSAIPVMEHLELALAQVRELDERLAFAAACLAAGRQAKASMATGPAANYLRMGRELLPDDAWHSETRLALDLHIEAAELAYIAENFDEAEALGALALEHARALEDRVAVHNIRIGIGVAQRRYVDATRYGIDVLRDELGVRLPRRATMPRVLASVAAARLSLAGKDDAAILALPDMQDPRSLAAMTIMMKSATNAYWADQQLVPIIAANMVRLAQRHGKTGLMAYGLALLGMVLSHALGRVDYGYRIGRLSIRLLEATGATHLAGKTGLLWHGWIRHNKEPLRLCAADTLACYHLAMDAGDVENAVYCGTVAYYGDLLSGRPLPWLKERYEDYLPALFASDQKHTIFALRVWLQAAANLGDPDRVEPRAVGEYIDWPAELAALEGQPGSAMSIATVAGAAGWLAFLLDDLDEAARQFCLLYEREQSALGQCFWKPCMAIYAVVLARWVEGGKATNRDRRRLARLRRALNGWARHNPQDFRCYQALVDAELSAGDLALTRWLDAVELARDSGNAWIEAWAAEQAAAAHAQRGHAALARHLDERARQIWQDYGAAARLRLLTGDTGRSAAAPHTRSPLEDLDFDTVLTAVRTVSESVEVNETAARVLELSMLNAGARRGALLIADGGLVPLVTGTMDEHGRVSTAPAATPDLPSSLVDFVSRTHEALIVDDAQTHEWLSRDPYVQQHGCRSILAMPLRRHADLVGLVLLENDLGAGVFSAADAAIAETIAGQAAVSLENARLFEAQRRQTEAFARFVPRPFLENLGHDLIEDVSLGDNVERRVNVMFADLRGFTSLSESMDRGDNFALLNGFHARMAPVLQAQGGFIDEFTGDGFKALFIDRADGAVQAAIGLQARLRRYNQSRRDKGRPELKMGVGVHTGQALLGTIGAEQRTSTTVIGDTVNTAARLEGLTKAFDTPALISGSTYDDLKDPRAWLTRPVGRVQVKGRQQAITVYELVDARPAEERERLAAVLDDFAAAMQAYLQRDFDAAAAAFADLRQRVPGDLLTEWYAKSAAELRASGVAEDWDGTIVRTEK